MAESKPTALEFARSAPDCHPGLASILATPHKETKDWRELLAENEMLVITILDSLLHHGDVLNTKGRSF